MSTASNRLFIQALDDGTTLHASIQSTKPLTQAWTGSAAVPNWTQSANQPIVYITLLSGSSYETPDSGGSWIYEGVTLTFDPTTHISTGVYAGKFQEVSYTPSGYSAAVPAIKIIGNLAASANVNTDTLAYSGTYTPSGVDASQALPINVSTYINITTVQSGGIFGVINFENGISTITQSDQHLVLTGTLYDDSDSPVSTFNTSWKINNVSKSDDTGHPHQLTITEDDITDNAIVECIFTATVNGASQTFSAFESIDDQQDDDVMYIQYNGANGNAASLRAGGVVSFSMWMGKMQDATVQTQWSSWKIRLHRADGSMNADPIPHTQDEPAIPDCDDVSTGLRTLPLSSNKAVFGASHNQVVSYFQKYLTGYIFASTSN